MSSNGPSPPSPTDVSRCSQAPKNVVQHLHQYWFGKWLALHSCRHDICNDASRLVATPPPPLDTTASFSHVHSPIRCPPPGTVIHGSDPLDHLPWFLSRHHVLVATALHLEVAQAGFVRLAKVVVLVVAG